MIKFRNEYFYLASIKLIQSDRKDVYNFTKDGFAVILNFSMNQRINILSSTIVFNIDHNKFIFVKQQIRILE